MSNFVLLLFIVACSIYINDTKICYCLNCVYFKWTTFARSCIFKAHNIIDISTFIAHVKRVPVCILFNRHTVSFNLRYRLMFFFRSVPYAFMGSHNFLIYSYTRRRYLRISRILFKLNKNIGNILLRWIGKLLQTQSSQYKCSLELSSMILKSRLAIRNSLDYKKL